MSKKDNVTFKPIQVWVICNENGYEQEVDKVFLSCKDAEEYASQLTTESGYPYSIREGFLLIKEEK